MSTKKMSSRYSRGRLDEIARKPVTLRSVPFLSLSLCLSLFLSLFLLFLFLDSLDRRRLKLVPISRWGYMGSMSSKLSKDVLV